MPPANPSQDPNPERRNLIRRRSGRKWAAALRYDPETDRAPRLTAKGAGALAEKILAIAREHGIYVHEDPDLVGALSLLEVNAEIPEELYRAVAEILAFLYRINAEQGRL
ncbi:MAG TPA: EscU/YscU/HrcU family type III secretion system export apparatus switch protein [Candidatus Hydrogenedentes bacterium]|nr:EscU/YscU/HrcU family type III secretion system export apparatus switch protein [Candidatus Hydrogenedentota bacterium]